MIHHGKNEHFKPQTSLVCLSCQGLPAVPKQELHVWQHLVLSPVKKNKLIEKHLNYHVISFFQQKLVVWKTTSQMQYRVILLETKIWVQHIAVVLNMTNLYQFLWFRTPLWITIAPDNNGLVQQHPAIRGPEAWHSWHPRCPWQNAWIGEICCFGYHFLRGNQWDTTDTNTQLLGLETTCSVM